MVWRGKVGLKTQIKIGQRYEEEPGRASFETVEICLGRPLERIWFDTADG